MKDKYTYEEITRATSLMFSMESGKQSIVSIVKESGINKFRIKNWLKRWRLIDRSDVFNQNHVVTLKCISNLTYGVSEEVWNRWLCEIDENLEKIKGLTLSNEIRSKLEEIAERINAEVQSSRGVDDEMIDRALAYLVDATRR